jgi:hypothetical protein
MRFLAFLTAFALSGIAFAEEPEVVKVYCFSADLEAGFKDGGAEYFCKELRSRGEKKNAFILADNRGNAHVLVQYLGIEKIITQGETTHLVGGYAWTPDQTKNGARAIVGVGEFTKGFHREGTGGTPPYVLSKDIEKWIRENREVILQKANKK